MNYQGFNLKTESAGPTTYISGSKLSAKMPGEENFPKGHENVISNDIIPANILENLQINNISNVHP